MHAATWSPAARRSYLLSADFWRTPPDVDVHGTRRLVDETAWAGFGHCAYVSIVGVDRSRLDIETETQPVDSGDFVA